MRVVCNLLQIASRLPGDRRAQDLIEYSLTAAFIAVAVSAFFPPSITPSISAVFSKVVALLDSSP